MIGGRSYVINLLVVSLISGAQNATSKIISKASDQIPSITLLGAASRVMQRTDSLSLSVAASVSTCLTSAQTTPQLTFLWTSTMAVGSSTTAFNSWALTTANGFS